MFANGIMKKSYKIVGRIYSMKFFKGKCGTVVTKLFETECEGGPLEELIPNTTDAAG